MKKFLLLLLAALLACSASATALADLDLSSVTASEDIYDLTVNEESEAAFIQTLLTSGDRAFVHSHESSTRYSNTKFDILVVNHGTEDAYPVLRLWIVYCADDGFMNFDSASFILDGKAYTFTDISDPDWHTQDDDGYVEQMLIRFSPENISFASALLQVLSTAQSEAGENAELMDALNRASVRLVLHGDEEIEAELGVGFLLDFLAMQTCMVNINGMEYLDMAYGTSMTVTDAQ